LTVEQNISLVRRFVSETFVSAGMVADVAVHIKDEENPHAHVLLTMRPFNEDKTWGAKIKKINKKPVYTIDWNDRGRAEEWRAAWADALNAELARYGFAETVDHRSYERQGVDKIPSVHLGVSAAQMERRGVATDRGNINREIAITNSQLRQTRARIDKVLAWADSVKSKTPPTLYEVLNSILNPGVDKTHGKRIADLKLAAKTLVFIQSNNISDLPALADKVASIRGNFNGIREDMKKTGARIKKLDEHIKQCDNFTENRGVMAMYNRLKSEADAAEKATGLFANSKAEKARKEAQDFYSGHTAEIEMFKAAEKYLRGTLQGRYDLKKISAQRKKWQGERDAKKTEQHNLNSKYHRLTDELTDAERLKKFAIGLMLPDEPQPGRSQQHQKSKSWEESL
jgi:hypothetical protein